MGHMNTCIVGLLELFLEFHLATVLCSRIGKGKEKTIYERATNYYCLLISHSLSGVLHQHSEDQTNARTNFTQTSFHAEWKFKSNKNVSYPGVTIKNNSSFLYSVTHFVHLMSPVTVMSTKTTKQHTIVFLS